MYYGRYRPTAMSAVFRHFNKTLVAWAMKKYKKLTNRKVRAIGFLTKLCEIQPHLFVHWQKGMAGAFA